MRQLGWSYVSFHICLLISEDVPVFISEKHFNLVIPIVPTVVLVVFLALFSTLIWLLRGRVKKKFKNIQVTVVYVHVL